MELDFHRPRTASDSYSCRPRASSFGKVYPGHRPRSSSYGHQVKPFKMKLGSKLGSYESVRMTSQELMHKASLDSMSQSSRDSLRMSSNESLRKLSEELRTKTNLLNTEYVDMNIDKRKTPSPLPPGQGGGYMDMTIGSRTASPSRAKVKDSGVMSASHSEEKVQKSSCSDQGDDLYMKMEATDVALGHEHHGKGDGVDVHSHRESGQAHRESGQAHRESGQAHRESGQAQRENDLYMKMEGTDGHEHHGKGDGIDVHPHRESGQAHRESGQAHRQSGQAHRESGQPHRESGQPQRESGQAHRECDLYMKMEATDVALGHEHHGKGDGVDSHSRREGGQTHRESGQTYRESGQPHRESGQPHRESGQLHREVTHPIHKDGPSLHHPVNVPSPVHTPNEQSDYIGFEPGQISSVSQSKKTEMPDSRAPSKKASSQFQQSKMSAKTSESTYNKKSSSGLARAAGGDSRKGDHHGRPVTVPEQPESYVMYEPQDQYVMYEPQQSVSSSHVGDSQGMPRHGSNESLPRKTQSHHSKDGAHLKDGAAKDSRKKRHSKSKRSSKMEADVSSPVESCMAVSCGFGFYKPPQKEGGSQSHTEEIPDEYIEFSPMRSTQTSLKSVRQKKSSDKTKSQPKENVQSEYIGFEPGLVPSSKEISRAPTAIKSMISVSPAGKNLEHGQKQNIVKSPSKNMPASGRDKPPSQYSRPSDGFFNFDFVRGGAGDANVQGFSDSRGCEEPDSVPLAGGSKPIGIPCGIKITQCSTIPNTGFVLAADSGTEKKPKESQTERQDIKLFENRDDKPPQRLGYAGSPIGIALSPKEISSTTAADMSIASVFKSMSPKDISSGAPTKDIVLSPKDRRASSKAVVISKDVTLSSDSVRVKHSSGGSLKGIILKEESLPLDLRSKHASGSSLSSESARSKHSSGGSAKGIIISRESSDISTVVNTPSPPVVETLDPTLAGMSRPGSTPCMLTLDELDTKQTPGATLTVDSSPRSRHSIADLGAYEKMSFTGNTLSSTQQQDSGEKVLNYASLDLGSSEAIGESDPNLKSPRIKSRHPSSNEERLDPPLSYASIDFEKSESLKNSGNKDVKFTL